MARPRLRGLLSTGDPALRAEIGSGRTPRNGAGSMATDADAKAASGQNLRQEAAE